MRIISTFFAVFFVLCLHAEKSIPSFAALQGQAQERPESTLSLLDSLESASALPVYRIDCLRAYAYHALSRYYMAMSCAKRALEADELQSDTAACNRLYMLMTESAVQAYSLGDAVQFITKGSILRSGRKILHCKQTCCRQKVTSTVKWGLSTKVMNTCGKRSICLLMLPTHRHSSSVHTRWDT